jgi:hypothetical protein
MIVQDMIEQLNLSIVTSANLADQVTGGYASDLLSCVMASAKAGNVWVTLQAHPNVVAVASLLELSAVIITEGVSPDPETMGKAHQEKVTLLATTEDTFTIVGKLAALDIEGTKRG